MRLFVSTSTVPQIVTEPPSSKARAVAKSFLGISIARTPTNTMVLSWPQPAPDWKLETTGALSNGAGVWTLIAPPYPTNSSAVLFTDTAPLSIRFYRLRAP